MSASNRKSGIYWANALFSEADRKFNEHYAIILRSRGYEVFLPQEASVNHGLGDSSPAASDIFWTDTEAILNCALMVACIDQETIDCGVACEIGIAYSSGIPIVGLYTDLRQYREGPGRMYKNLYVIGAIDSCGVIVSNERELLRAIPKYLEDPDTAGRGYPPKVDAASHFDVMAPVYLDYVSRLESFYHPSWRAEEVVGSWVMRSGAKHVFEFGCGAGSLGKVLCERLPEITYVGYDASPGMIEAAKATPMTGHVLFTTSWSSVVARAPQSSFDMVVCLFALHDLANKKEILAQLASLLCRGGLLLIIDLSTLDLPELTQLLRRSLGRMSPGYDGRLEPISLTSVASELGLSMVDYQLVLPAVAFPTAEDVDEYLTMFGIYKGMDLPLGIVSGQAEHARAKIAKALACQTYPFQDRRVFAVCALGKL